MIERLETPPLESLGTPPADDNARSSALALLMASPEVEVIGRMLANIERKRLGFASILRLENLEPEETEYYRERAVMAIRLLDREQEDEAIFCAAKGYAIKTYDCTLEALSPHKQFFCVWVARAMCKMFTTTLSGHIPLSGAESRWWKALEAKMKGERA